jgi:hypothetical protein
MPRELIALEAALVARAIYILQQAFAFAPAINEHSLGRCKRRRVT